VAARGGAAIRGETEEGKVLSTNVTHLAHINNISTSTSGTKGYRGNTNTYCLRLSVLPRAFPYMYSVRRCCAQFIDWHLFEFNPLSVSYTTT
jgi:hypothetical protein